MGSAGAETGEAADPQRENLTRKVWGNLVVARAGSQTAGNLTYINLQEACGPQPHADRRPTGVSQKSLSLGMARQGSRAGSDGDWSGVTREGGVEGRAILRVHSEGKTSVVHGSQAME